MRNLLFLVVIAALLITGCAFSIGTWFKTGDDVHKLEYTTPAPIPRLPMTGPTAEASK